MWLLVEEFHSRADADHFGEFRSHPNWSGARSRGSGSCRSWTVPGSRGCRRSASTMHDPDSADRTVRAWLKGQDLVVLALLEVDLRIVGVAGVQSDTIDLHRARRRWRVGRADGCRVGGNQCSGLIIGKHLFAVFVGDDARDLGFLGLARIDDPDDGAGHR